MADIFYQPKSRMFSNDGSIGSGYKFYFYQTGTTTPITTYSDSSLTTANTNPVVADSYGYFNLIYVSDFSQVKVIVKDSDDNLIYTADPVNPSGSSSITLNDLGVRPTSYWGLTAGTASAYTLAANPTLPSYSNYNTFFIQFHVACNASPTLDIDGLGAKNIKRYTGQGTKIALQAGDIQAAERYVGAYDGVDIVILNPRSNNIYTGTAPTLTIATGVVTLTNGGAAYTIDTEASSASDDLDTINGGATGEIIILGTANDSRDVVIKNGTGNIINPSGLDITLGTTNDRAILSYNGSSWIVLSNTLSAQPQLLLSQTASSSAQLNFTNLATTYAGYNTYVLKLIDVTPATDNVSLNVRYSTNNGSTFISTNNYTTTLFGIDSGGSPYGDNATNTSFIQVTGISSIVTVDNNSSYGVNGTLEISNISGTSKFKSLGFDTRYFNNSSRVCVAKGAGYYTGATTAINALRIYFSSGNISSGTIELWGYK